MLLFNTILLILFYLRKNIYWLKGCLFVAYFCSQQPKEQVKRGNRMHKKITNSKPSNNITDLQMKSKKQTDLITGMDVQFWKKVTELKMDMLLQGQSGYNLWRQKY